mmetsp:Transcript_11328/g.25978  ORF Transcript_11328/g.25978 Transcript_11328/m.25978 type:complete len:237 (-) Transcript_11328:27-737(-)
MQATLGIEEALGQVPVVERYIRFYARIDEAVNQVVVEGNALKIDAIDDPARWDDASPRYAEAVVPQAHGLHERDIRTPIVVVVASDVASGALVHHARVDGARRIFAAIAATGARHANGVRTREGVPDGGAAAALPVGALHLIGRSTQAPHERRWEHSLISVVHRVLPWQVGQRILGASVKAKACGRGCVDLRPLQEKTGKGRIASGRAGGAVVCTWAPVGLSSAGRVAATSTGERR